MKRYTIPIFIPELACPFRCIYCNQHVISGKISIPTNKQIKDTIASRLLTFKRDAYIELGFFGGNFTGIPYEMQEELLSLVQPYIHEKKINSIRISTRPDYISPIVLAILKKYHVETIELGVQSMDDEVLSLSRRGYDSETVVKAAGMIREEGFNLGMQMMIGLPGDSKEKSRETAEAIVKLGAVCTRIYPTLVVKDTELSKMYQTGNYQALSMAQAIDWTKEPLRIFEENGITVLRVGLHPTEGFISGSDFLEGPFHVSFKELVLTEIWKDRLWEACAKEKDIRKNLLISISKKDMNYAVGYQSKNKIFFSRHFEKVHFYGHPDIKSPGFEIKTEFDENNSVLGKDEIQ